MLQPRALWAARAARAAASRTPPLSHALSTSSPLFSVASQAQQQQPATPPPPPPPPPRGSHPSFMPAALFLLLGVSIGTAARAVVSPLPPILPATKLDDLLAADIRAAAAGLPLVKRLLADPEWAGSHHDAYEGIPPAARPHRITTGPLAGTRGVGAYQHVFHNRRTGEVVAVVYLGPGTIGWPGVVHGGAIATLLDEHSARAAFQDLGGAGLLTASLDIAYKRPTLASDFYVLRARAVPDAQLAPADRGRRASKVWVDASIETLAGRTCVQSRSLFVAPKSVSLGRMPENF